MSHHAPIRFALDGVPGFGPSPAIAGWLFAPRDIDPAREQPVAFCIHGGSYDKRYFHIEAPGSDGYSLCDHFAARGVITVATDCLGVGESARADEAEFITIQALALANRRAATELAERLKSGMLSPGIPPLPRVVMTGIGHSLGGLLLIAQQAAFRSFDRVAVLGWSNLGLDIDKAELQPDLDSDGKYAYCSAALRRSFHLADVPEAVLACPAEREVSPVSMALAAETADLDAARRAAAAITVPVFLCYGEKDVSPAPRAEVACYENADDITFLRLSGSAHCHNFATARAVLWERLLRWMAAPV